jgi:hypothetical protein
MRIISKLLMAGTAAIAVAGAALAADKAVRNDHVMTVRMPDGTVRNIPYPDDVAPRIVFVPVGAAVSTPTARPVAAPMISPFAMFDRIAAQMDAQAGAMLQQAAAISAAPSSAAHMVAADGRQVPGGVVSYSFFSSTSSDGKASCSRSVQITSFDPKQPPKVASQSSGDCSKMADINVRATAAPAAAPKPVVTPARYDAPRAKPASRAEPTI